MDASVILLFYNVLLVRCPWNILARMSRMITDDYSNSLTELLTRFGLPGGNEAGAI